MFIFTAPQSIDCNLLGIPGLELFMHLAQPCGHKISKYEYRLTTMFLNYNWLEWGHTLIVTMVSGGGGGGGGGVSKSEYTNLHTKFVKCLAQPFLVLWYYHPVYVLSGFISTPRLGAQLVELRMCKL